jgi:predicted TIM-barrel fold metal-dependent hydrolase
MTIDVHGHLSPPDAQRRFPMPPSLTDVAGMIEHKLAHDVTMTIVGSPVGAGAMAPIPGVDNYAQDNDTLRRFHDWLSATVAEHPDHLRGLVYANAFGDDRHLTSVADTFRSAAFVGLITNTSVNGHYLDDSRADGFFDLAEELGAPVVLHAPAWPAAGHGLTDPRLIEQLGRFGDVTLAVACLILSGRLDKHPNLQLIAAGGGGALAMLPRRLDLIATMPHWGPQRPGQAGPRPEPLRQPPSSYLRRIWVDTAGSGGLHMRANVEVFGAQQMLFGTDSPPLVDVVGPGLAEIDALPVPEADKHAIRRGNAEHLFGLIPAGSSTQANDTVRSERAHSR